MVAVGCTSNPDTMSSKYLHIFRATVLLSLVASVVCVPPAGEDVLMKENRPLGLPIPKVDSETCGRKSANCEECIKHGCAWCYSDEQSKCLAPTAVSECRGPGWQLENPVSSASPEPSPSQEDYSLALTPLRYRVNLRVGESLDLPMNLTVAANQELDLYYLTDISMSMQDDLILLKEIGKDIEEKMESRTTKFSIGFGTFIDKNIIPFNIKEDLNKERPRDDLCNSTFGFCNAMSLEENGGDHFNEVVEIVLASVTSNKDALEGGLDALMQVLVCGDAIGWRHSARKLVIFVTGDGFKYQGDGRLAGLDELNDGQCHLDGRNKTYTHSLLHDYPSISQIKKAMTAADINVVFAVTGKVLPLYDALKEQLLGAQTAQITEDSSNILQIIDEEFDKMSSTLKLTSNAPGILKVEFEYDCPEGGPSKCNALKYGSSVNVKAKVTLLSCPKDGSDSLQVAIDGPGLKNTVTLDISLLCSCGCLQTAVPASNKCTRNGTLSCGVCSCDSGYYGERCECYGMERADTSACKESEQASVCSDNGQCVCSQCSCNVLVSPKEFQGKYCECSNYGCPRKEGKLCGGHGECDCNKCMCDVGWSGKNCGCEEDIANCRQQESDEVDCSGHGECKCNKCECGSTDDSGSEKYYGTHCENCPTCGGECSSMSICAKCYLLEEESDNKVALSKDQCLASKTECSNVTVSFPEQKPEGGVSECLMETGDCRRVFYYRLGNDSNDNINSQIYIAEKWDCDTPIWVIIVSVAGSVVLVGLLSLAIWWYVNQQKEAKKSAEVQQMGDKSLDNYANLNQLYKHPIDEVTNPLYGQNV